MLQLTVVMLCCACLTLPAVMCILPLCWCPGRFAAINGLLLPGGGANLSPGHPFYDAATNLVLMALDANDKGDYFPVSDETPAQCSLSKSDAVAVAMLGCCAAVHAAWSILHAAHAVPGVDLPAKRWLQGASPCCCSCWPGNCQVACTAVGFAVQASSCFVGHDLRVMSEGVPSATSQGNSMCNIAPVHPPRQACVS
jgi:hypothetical protein